MDDLLKRWHDGFYTLPALMITLIIALAISIRNKNKHSVMKYFTYYILSLLMMYVCVVIVNYLNASGYFKPKFYLTDTIDYLFTLFEFFIFLNFFYKILRNAIFKKTIIYLAVLFTIYSIYALVTDNAPDRFISHNTVVSVYTVEAIILIAPCIFYFIQLFKEPAVLNLKNEPGFWIATGLFFFITCTLPYSLIENYMSSKYFFFRFQLYSIFYIFYILLFLMIIRAYLCKPTIAI